MNSQTIKDSKKIREANEGEKQALIWCVAEVMGGFEANDNWDVASVEVDKAYIAVFPNYVSDSQGYRGKVMAVVWAGDPSLYEVFIWRDGQIERLDQALEFRES